MNDILMSIQTKYARKIFSGEKKWEFRKNLPNSSPLFPARVFVYSSGNEKAIIGVFTVKQVVKTKFDLLMKITNSNKSEKDLEWFSKYYKDSRLCGAIEIGKLTHFRKPITLNEIKAARPDFRPPQNFYYLERLQEIKNLIDVNDMD